MFAIVLVHNRVQCDNKVVYRSRCISGSTNGRKAGVAAWFLFSFSVQVDLIILGFGSVDFILAFMSYGHNQSKGKLKERSK